MVSTSLYSKAIESLEKSIRAFDSEQNSEIKVMLRDSVIQRFEFSLELAWKTAVRKLGFNTSAPKIAIREMARNNLIADPVLWFEFVEARNNSSHTYDETIAKEVLAMVRKFLPEGQKLERKLESL